jgi:hypothetical protein
MQWIEFFEVLNGSGKIGNTTCRDFFQVTVYSLPDAEAWWFKVAV